MKLLYLCPSPYLGIRDRSGWSTHMAGVISALRDQGHEVRPYLAATRQPRASSRSRASRVPAPRVDRRRMLREAVPVALRVARRDLYELWHDRRLDRQVLRACQSFGAEAIYERTEVYHGVGARVSRRLGLPLVLEVNGPLVDERQAWAGILCPGLARRIEATKYAAADAIVTVSAALTDYLCAQGVERSKIHAVPNGADITLFQPDRAHPAAIRANYGLGRRLVIGFVGAFADWHSLETLVGAVSDVACSRVLDLHLLMIGDGPNRLPLRELAHRMGLEGRATLPGSVSHDQVPHAIAAMDICVLPSSNWYMSPIKLFEYGAMGRAVIAPRTPAVCEVMTHREDGLLVQPGCREGLREAIHYLACRPEERVRMATTFQHRVRQQHSWETVAGRVSQLLEHSLQARQAAVVTGEPRVEAAR